MTVARLIKLLEKYREKDPRLQVVFEIEGKFPINDVGIEYRPTPFGMKMSKIVLME